MKVNKKIEMKRLKEQKVVGEMIALYCRKHHKGTNGKELCPSCKELLIYSNARSEKCPFMEQKTFCANCRIHCYKPEMRERIKEVMRFSGPRILFYHPVITIWHLICSIKEKFYIKKSSRM